MEYLRGGNNELVTLEYCTAASNILAGTPVLIDTGGSNIFSMSNTTGMAGCTATLGNYFVGVLAADISANASPVSVYTKGVFQFLTVSGQTSALVAPGWPVFAAPTGDAANSSMYVSIGTGLTSDAAIGTLVNRPAECTGVGGVAVHVRINPAMFRWTTWVGAAYGGAFVTGSQAAPMGWPKLKGHA